VRLDFFRRAPSFPYRTRFPCRRAFSPLSRGLPFSLCCFSLFPYKRGGAFPLTTFQALTRRFFFSRSGETFPPPLPFGCALRPPSNGQPMINVERFGRSVFLQAHAFFFPGRTCLTYSSPLQIQTMALIGRGASYLSFRRDERPPPKPYSPLVSGRGIWISASSFFGQPRTSKLSPPPPPPF